MTSTANFKHHKFLWGLGYRNHDAILLLLGFSSKYVRFGYSYDITISKLSTAAAGSHELNLGVLFNHKKIPEKLIAVREFQF